MTRNSMVSFLKYQLKTRWRSLLISGPCVYILLYLITLLAAPFAGGGGSLFLIGAGLAFTINMTFGVIAHVNRAVGSRRAFVLFPASKEAKVAGITLYSLIWMVMNIVIWLALMLLSAVARGEEITFAGGKGGDPVVLLAIAAAMVSFSLFALFFALIRQHHGIMNLLLFTGVVAFALFMGRLFWSLFSLAAPSAGGDVMSLGCFLFQGGLFYGLAYLALSRMAFRED